MCIFDFVLAVHGGWTPWSQWTECDVTCGTGLKQRVRACTNPSPKNGGHLCTGKVTQAVPCTEDCLGKEKALNQSIPFWNLLIVLILYMKQIVAYNHLVPDA